MTETIQFCTEYINVIGNMRKVHNSSLHLQLKEHHNSLTLLILIIFCNPSKTVVA